MNRRVLAAAGGVVAVLLIGWYLVLWRPASSHLQTAQAADAAAMAQRSSLESSLAGLRAEQRKLPPLETQVQAGVRSVPLAASVDTAIDEISGIAVDDAIQWTNETQSLAAAESVAPTTTVAPVSSTTATSTVAASTTPAAAAGATVATGGSSTLALTLTLSGSYPHMIKFITDLEHLPRLIVLDTVSYTSATPGSVGATIGGRAFYDATPIPSVPTTVGGG